MRFASEIITTIPDDCPVLIAGPTASGKSSLALEIARRAGGVIVNADALQVYSGWRLLSARPSCEEEAEVEHHLYGHVPYQQDYSVGHWLQDVKVLLGKAGGRPIIVGGTGLYFRALTEGLADIPVPEPEIRAAGDALLAARGLASMRAQIDAETLAMIDKKNPARVQRAWEVLRATGKGLAAWQARTPPPLLAPGKTFPIVLDAERDWLNERIARRFDQMIENGALDEARAMLADWDPSRLSSKAIGAPELIAHLQGALSLEGAISRAKLASRQYAKRQRTWFRARMKNWHHIALPV